jgi:hypothetical protein
VKAIESWLVVGGVCWPGEPTTNSAGASMARAVGAGAAGVGVGWADPETPYLGAESPEDDPAAAIDVKGVGQEVAV